MIIWFLNTDFEYSQPQADHDQPGPPQFDAPMPENIQNGHLSEDVQEVLKEAEPPKEAPKNEPIQNGFETKVDDVEVSKEEIKTKEEEKKEDKKKEEEEKEDRPPTPPAPLEHAPQLEITIPTPTEGGKTTSELLQGLYLKFFFVFYFFCFVLVFYNINFFILP